MFRRIRWMQFLASKAHCGSKTRLPDPVLESGAHRKSTHFRRGRSFPSTGGLGVSALTLSPDRFSGRRPGSRGLSLRQASEVGVTAIVYAAHLKYAIGALKT